MQCIPVQCNAVSGPLLCRLLGRSIIKHFVSQYVFYSAGNCGIYLYDANHHACNLQQHNAVSANAHCFQSTLPSAYCTYRSVVNSRLFQKHFYTCLQRTVTSERSTYSNTLDFRNLWLAPSMRAMLQSSSYFYYVYALWSSAKPTHFSWVRWKGSLILSAELSLIKNLSHFSLESV